MRTRRSATAETRVSVRDYVMVSEGLWSLFHQEWRKIEREWRGAIRVADVELVPAPDTYTKLVSPGVLEAVRLGVDAARDELRKAVRRMAPDFPGTYLVPV